MHNSVKARCAYDNTSNAHTTNIFDEINIINDITRRCTYIVSYRQQATSNKLCTPEHPAAHTLLHSHKFINTTSSISRYTNPQHHHYY